MGSASSRFDVGESAVFGPLSGACCAAGDDRSGNSRKKAPEHPRRLKMSQIDRRWKSEPFGLIDGIETIISDQKPDQSRIIKRNGLQDNKVPKAPALSGSGSFRISTTATTRIKGWEEAELAQLETAVQDTASDLKIKAPNFSALQVRACSLCIASSIGSCLPKHLLHCLSDTKQMHHRRQALRHSREMRPSGGLLSSRHDHSQYGEHFWVRVAKQLPGRTTADIIDTYTALHRSPIARFSSSAKNLV